MLYTHQFCLSTTSLQSQEDCKLVVIGNYTLKYHRTLAFAKSVPNLLRGATSETYKLFLLGDIFSYQHPKYTNQNILDDLAKSHHPNDLFKALEPYCGSFVLIVETDNDLCIIPDAAAQREVFYNKDYSFIASQVGLFPNVDLDNIPDHPYYTSTLFNKKRIYIGDTTPIPHIKRLLPNHFLSSLTQSTKRFYPIAPRKPASIDAVAPQAAQMLQGFIEAISHRHELVIPVTGGFDSRMLFLASLPLKAHYYISQHEGMPDDHFEITTARKVVALFGKELQVIKDGPETCYFASEPHGVDFPRDMSFPRLAQGKMVINGNVSEVGRNARNYHSPNGRRMAQLNYFGNNSFVIKVCDEWLSKNRKYIQDLDYDPLDFFYWEDNMANWAAKGKSETRVMDVEMISPFNSSGLLDLLLSTPKNSRERVNGKLHHKIVEQLTDKHQELRKITINPEFDIIRARVLWKLGLFKLFDRLRLQAKMLKSRIKSG